MKNVFRLSKKMFQKLTTFTPQTDDDVLREISQNTAHINKDKFAALMRLKYAGNQEASAVVDTIVASINLRMKPCIMSVFGSFGSVEKFEDFAPSGDQCWLHFKLRLYQTPMSIPDYHAMKDDVTARINKCAIPGEIYVVEPLSMFGKGCIGDSLLSIYMYHRYV